MVEYLEKLIDKYEDRVKVIDDYLDEHDLNTYSLTALNGRKDCYEEIISDLESLLNSNM